MTAELPVAVAVGEGAVTISPGMVRDMFLRGDLQQTMDMVAGLASKIFTCNTAVLTMDNGKITSGAATHPAVQRAGDLQMQYGEGPSVDAIVDRRHSVVDDLRVESRWRFWAPQAAQLGFRSLISVSLTEHHTMGVLNLYSNRPRTFRAADLATAEVFAQHAALALTVANERAQLKQAVEARTLIGQAQGVLMQRYQLDADQAFKVMRRFSSHSNRKLRQVAADVVRHRHTSTHAEDPS
jgi:GAF domain-containing protein